MEHKNLDYKDTGLPDSQLMDSLYSLAQGVWQDQDMGSDMEWEGHALWAADTIKKIREEYPELTEEGATAVMLRNLPVEIPSGIVQTRCFLYRQDFNEVMDVFHSYDQYFPIAEGLSQEAKNIQMAEFIVTLRRGLIEMTPDIASQNIRYVEGMELGNPELKAKLVQTLRDASPQQQQRTTPKFTIN